MKFPPGTHVTERIKRRDPPVNEIDRLARNHDVAYMNAKKMSDIKKADKRMIKGLKIEQRSGKNPKTAKLVEKLLKMKVIGEDYGILGKTDITDLSHVKDDRKPSAKNISAAIDLIKEFGPRIYDYLKKPENRKAIASGVKKAVKYLMSIFT